MSKLRRLHTYLGVFFAPLLLLFVVTGWYQYANPDRRKSLGEQEGVWDRLRAVHADGAFPMADVVSYKTRGFKWVVYSMAAALTLTVGLGLWLAFRATRPRWAVGLAFVLGIVVPIAALLLGQRR